MMAENGGELEAIREICWWGFVRKMILCANQAGLRTLVHLWQGALTTRYVGGIIGSVVRGQWGR